MSIHPEAGELLVGAYLRVIEGCEIVTYNQRSHDPGIQLEVDVLGIRGTENGQVVYVCEVVTHLNGLHYSGTPSTETWAEYGNASYQYSLEQIWQKFWDDWEYVTDVFDEADSYRFQLWSPLVRGNRDEQFLLGGLHDLAEKFEDNTGKSLDLIVNERYSENIDILRERARETDKPYGEPGFRMVQILENLRR